MRTRKSPKNQERLYRSIGRELAQAAQHQTGGQPMRDSDTLLKIIHECQDLQDRYDPKTGHWAGMEFTPYQAELMKIVLVNLGQLRLAALNAE